MERMSYFVALSMGFAGLLCGLLLAKRRSSAAKMVRAQWLFGLLLPLIVFLATLPVRPPFESGQGFGRGFLLGGLGAMLAGWLVLRIERRDESRSGGMASTLALVTPQSVGLIVATAPLLWMRQNLLDTLMGVAIGWLCSSLPLLLTVQNPKSEILNSDSADALPLIAGIGFVATLCALFALGEMRAPAALFHSTQRVSWNIVGAILAAGVPFCLLICSRVPFAAPYAPSAAEPENSSRKWALWVNGFIGVILFAVLTERLGSRVLPQGATLRLAEAGVVTALLAYAVLTTKAAQGHENHALGLLLFAAGGMISFQWMQGVGVGIWLLAAWLIVSITLARGQEDGLPHLIYAARQMLNLALFGVILLLYRVVQSRFSEDIQPATLTDQYALFGLLIGAFSPALLSGYAERNENRLFRLLPVGLLTLAIPGIALLLYGAKCALALIIGAALSFAPNPPAPFPDSFAPLTGKGESFGGADPVSPFPVMRSERIREGGWGVRSLFALALALALSQWTGRALDYTLLAKAQKLHLLEAIGGAVILLVLMADYGGRFRAWRENRDSVGNIGKGAAQ